MKTARNGAGDAESGPNSSEIDPGAARTSQVAGEGSALPETFQLGPPVDPHPLLACARQGNPVQPGWPLSTSSAIGTFDSTSSASVLGYDEAVMVFRDGETYSSAAAAEAIGPLLAHTMVAMDGADHRTHRALVAHAFRPRQLARWEEGLVRRVADELIDPFAPLGRVDLVREFAFSLPVLVIARILGLPEENAPQFRRWSIELIGIGLDWERGMAAFGALRGYFAAQVEDRRAEPRDDLISDLVSAEIDGNRLSDEEIFATLRLLLPAGIETTYRSIGNMLYALLTHPDQLAEVRGNPELVLPAVEEALRWEPPIVMTGRQSVRPSTLAGVDVPVGTSLSVFLASANRDERRFADPDRFDIRRGHGTHLAFGSGPHACLGMHLARMEMRIALTALLERLPDLRLDPDEDTPELAGIPLRSPSSLPVMFAPSPKRVTTPRGENP